MLNNTQIRDLSDLEELLLQEILRETEDGDQANSERGVFVRPLKKEAFKKHVEGLESY
jgi:hydroxypyruvate isomerase